LRIKFLNNVTIFLTPGFGGALPVQVGLGNRALLYFRTFFCFLDERAGFN